jgi:hypothetical protein
VAAARGLPIPAADEVPLEEERSLSPEPRSSTPVIQNLMVPISSPSHSYASDTSANLSPSHPAFSLPPPASPIASPSLISQSSSPFRPRSKTLASLTTASKTPYSGDMVPHEIHLPRDPYVNRQAMEAFLYKDAAECPICLIYYPPYLNRTRCCDQPICSECFVQIKRPDPHPPEHEHNDTSNPGTSQPPSDPELLVSEPANCPYCQQPEFGVTYEPPPFRKGLIYANMAANNPLGNVASAMSSSSSLNSVGSPALASTTTSRRRTISISANASTVITTDRIRPDWATKLANARSHAARRSAAATALHTAAYLMGNNMPDSRGFAFTSRSRFGRRGGESPGSGAATPATSGAGPNNSLSPFAAIIERHDTRSGDGNSQGGGSSRRRSRMDDLEDMMMLEAIRLSLAAEEERKKKVEKEAKKEAKKKEKAEKKAEKAAKKMYSAGGNNSSVSASGSALSLSLPGIGRRRGNSGSSAFLRETANTTDKGKSVDRGTHSSATEASGPPAPLDLGRSSIGTVLSSRHHLDSAGTGAPLADTLQPSPTTTAPERPSHLRQMSNASSPASSFVESTTGSLRNGFHGSSSSLDSPNASGTHLVGGTPDREVDAGNPAVEPMFNFRSLAEIIGREEEKENRSNHIEYSHGDSNSSFGHHQRGESSASARSLQEETMDQSIATLKVDPPGKDDKNPDGTKHDFEDSNSIKLPTPELMITPVTPASIEPSDGDSKQLGEGLSFDMTQTDRVTQ